MEHPYRSQLLNSAHAVSIPERVWGGLERTSNPPGMAAMVPRFQSLRGFGVGWSEICDPWFGWLFSLFQSLRGFGVGWSNPRTAIACRVFLVSIPERVWGGLEQARAKPPRPGRIVSIPERVWGGLEPQTFSYILLLCIVSIPERVWGGLEHPGAQRPRRIQGPFQSLRGFGVGWSLTW